MNIQVGTHEIIITQDENINAGEYNVTPCTFDFSDEYEGLTIQAVFTRCDGTNTIVSVANNECIIPFEVLQTPGQVLLGVYGYEGESNNLVLRYSPKPQYFVVQNGSYKEGQEPTPPTPSSWDILVEQVETNTENITEIKNKTDNLATVATTGDYEDLTNKPIIELVGEDGNPIDLRELETGLYTIEGFYTDGTTTYGVDDAIIEMTVSKYNNGSNDCLYIDSTMLYWYYEKQDNTYELVSNGNYLTNDSLTDYVKNTDYATDSKGGVIKASSGVSVNSSTGNIAAGLFTYANYQTKNDYTFIGKGTLENVITGKGLVSNTSYATSSVGGVLKTNENTAFTLHTNGYPVCSTITYSNYSQYLSNNAFISKGTLENVLTARIGDINSVLDSINGEVI